jgi:hypothetical protein
LGHASSPAHQNNDKDRMELGDRVLAVLEEAGQPCALEEIADELGDASLRKDVLEVLSAELTARGLVRRSVGEIDVWELGTAAVRRTDAAARFGCKETLVLVDGKAHGAARFSLEDALPRMVAGLTTQPRLYIVATVPSSYVGYGSAGTVDALDDERKARLTVVPFPVDQPALAQMELMRRLMALLGSGVEATHVVMLTDTPLDYRYITGLLIARSHVVNICTTLLEAIEVLDAIK